MEYDCDLFQQMVSLPAPQTGKQLTQVQQDSNDILCKLLNAYITCTLITPCSNGVKRWDWIFGHINSDWISISVVLCWFQGYKKLWQPHKWTECNPQHYTQTPEVPVILWSDLLLWQNTTFKWGGITWIEMFVTQNSTDIGNFFYLKTPMAVGLNSIIPLNSFVIVTSQDSKIRI